MDQRPSKTSERRNQLAAEQNHRCCYCGVVFNYHAQADHPDAPTIEHVKRLADGGQRGWENEVAACWFCNNTRGNISAGVYYEIVRRDGRVDRHGLLQAKAQQRSKRGVVIPLPPPPLTMKLIEYFQMVYGKDVAARLIGGRGQGAAMRQLLAEKDAA